MSAHETSRRIGLYVLSGKLPVAAASVDAWAQWMEAAQRRVAFTRIDTDIYVSTVFLGLDRGMAAGPPLVFETMAFTGRRRESQRHRGAAELGCRLYATWAEAEAGHAEIVATLKARQ